MARWQLKDPDLGRGPRRSHAEINRPGQPPACIKFWDFAKHQHGGDRRTIPGPSQEYLREYYVPVGAMGHLADGATFPGARHFRG